MGFCVSAASGPDRETFPELPPAFLDASQNVSRDGMFLERETWHFLETGWEAFLEGGRF